MQQSMQGILEASHHVPSCPRMRLIWPMYPSYGGAEWPPSTKMHNATNVFVTTVKFLLYCD